MKKIIRLTESDLTRLIKRIVKENEDENFWGRVKLDFGRPKDFDAILSDISDLFSYLISNSAGVEEFETQVNEFIQDNQEDIDNLTDDERNKLNGFINGVKTRYNFN